jgi:hypothetical protein
VTVRRTAAVACSFDVKGARNRLRISHGREIASVLIVLAPAVLFGALGWSIGWGIATGAVAALFLNFEKVKSLKYKGLEIELRQAIKEAYATTESVKKIARTLLLSAMYNLNRANRIADGDDSEVHKIRDELDRLGRDLQVHDDEDVLAAHETFYRLHAWDRFGRFSRTFRSNPVVYNEIAKLLDYDSTSYPDEAAIAEACRYLGEHPMTPEQLAAKQEFLRYARERTALIGPSSTHAVNRPQ